MAGKPSTDEGAAKKKAERAAKKVESFKRMGKLRTNKTLDGFRKLMALRASNYQSTQEQRDMITKALRGALEKLETVYGGEKLGKDENEFAFD